MAWPSFKQRDLKRDRKTDRLRMEAVIEVLSDSISAIEREKSGLVSRYEAVADDAAFFMEAVENGEVPASPNLDAMANTISRYRERLRDLDAQSALLSRMRESTLSFSAHLDGAPSAADARRADDRWVSPASPNGSRHSAST